MSVEYCHSTYIFRITDRARATKQSLPETRPGVLDDLGIKWFVSVKNVNTVLYKKLPSNPTRCTTNLIYLLHNYTSDSDKGRYIPQTT